MAVPSPPPGVVATHTLIATPDPPPVGIANPIHADDGAGGAGYQGALVAGVRTYGWVAEVVIRELGAGWLDAGWADVTMRRPLYTGETVTITLSTTGDAGTWSVAAGVGDRVVLDGLVGTGTALWADQLNPPPPAPALDPPPVRPTYDLVTAPVGEPLRPLGAWVSADAARRLTLDDLGQTVTGLPDGRLHPWFLAARMAPLTRHNFTYGPTIHVRTQIQHLGPAPINTDVVVGARIVDVYDRKDHWYQVLDGLVVGAGAGPGAPELARLRHTTIFRPRGTVMPPPVTA